MREWGEDGESCHTFAVLGVRQTEARWAQALVAHPQVLADVAAASVVVQTLVCACNTQSNTGLSVSSLYLLQRTGLPLSPNPLIREEQNQHLAAPTEAPLWQPASKLTTIPQRLVRPITAVVVSVANAVHADALAAATLEVGRGLTAGG